MMRGENLPLSLIRYIVPSRIFRRILPTGKTNPDRALLLSPPGPRFFLIFGTGLAGWGGFSCRLLTMHTRLHPHPLTEAFVPTKKIRFTQI